MDSPCYSTGFHMLPEEGEVPEFSARPSTFMRSPLRATPIEMVEPVERQEYKYIKNVCAMLRVPTHVAEHACELWSRAKQRLQYIPDRARYTGPLELNQRGHLLICIHLAARWDNQPDWDTLYDKFVCVLRTELDIWWISRLHVSTWALHVLQALDYTIRVDTEEQAVTPITQAMCEPVVERSDDVINVEDDVPRLVTKAQYVACGGYSTPLSKGRKRARALWC